MSQVFHPAMNAVARASLLGIVIVVSFLGWAGYEIQASPYSTNQGIIRDQPVPFSHEHHVRGLGLDCRYCHTSVEDSSFAGMPATDTCMTCHSKVWTNAPVLQPIRDSWQTNLPIGYSNANPGWVRVHNLPKFVYFDHSIHVNKGVGCTTCHGQVDQMPLMYQAATVNMAWCLHCHREPEKYLRPRDQVFSVTWQPPGDQLEQGRHLAAEYHVAPASHLQTCYVCHR